MSDASRPWPEEIEGLLATCRIFRSVRVLAETASTQDVAKSFADQPGLVVTTLRQTAGRGRLGRVWADTAADGVAATFVVPVAGEVEELALRSAIAAAIAVEAASSCAVGIKWPNDLIVGGRKLGGILIERGGSGQGVAWVGIGINVAQEVFPPDLARRATSLRLEGRSVDRLDVLLRLISAFDKALEEPIDAVMSAYAQRDVLTGSWGTFGTPEGPCEGQVIRIDPLRGLVVRGAAGDTRFLRAATTSVLSWKPRPSASR